MQRVAAQKDLLMDEAVAGDRADKGATLDAKASSVWDKLESSSKIISAIAIPIVIAIGGWWIQNSITRQSISKDYVALAISVLEKPKAEIDQSLRDWAVDLLNEYAPSKFPADTISRLKSGSISLGALTAVLASKASSRIAIAPDAHSIAVGGRDMAISIFDLRTAQPLKTLLGHTDSITSLAFTPDGRRLFSGSLDKTVKEWDVAAGTLLRTAPFKDAVYDIAVSADGARLVVGLADDTFLTFDTRSGNLLISHANR